MKFRILVLLSMLAFALTACGFSLAEDITPPPNYVSPTPGPTDSPLYPPAAPNLTNGKAIFAEKCAPCHGESGLGDGPMAAQLQKQPAAIGSLELGRKAALVNWFTMVTEGNINSFMPPFKDSLSDQDRWDVVAYSLSLGGINAKEAAAGKIPYEANCAQCHGTTGNLIPTSDFNDQALMSKVSQDDIANFTVNGVGRMPGFGETISTEDVYAIAAYLRTFTVQIPAETAQAESIEPTNTPVAPTAETGNMEATASPENQTSDAEVTPSTDATVDPMATPADLSTEATIDPLATTTEPAPVEPTATTAAIGSIQGKVINGSSDQVPGGLTITLHGFTHNTESQQFSEVVTLETEIAPDGSYSFEDVSFEESQAFYTSVDFSGTTYNSDPGFIEPGATVLELPLTVFETTSDQTDLKADQIHLLLDYTKPDVVQVVEFLIFSNAGTKSIVGAEDGGIVIDVPLPDGYTNLQFESGAIGDRYLKTQKGFADTTAVLPGEQAHQIVFAVDLPLSKANLFGSRSVKITQEIPFTASQVTILSPEGITINGSNVTPNGLTDMGNGAKYLSYAVSLNSANKNISLTITGTPKDSTVAATSSNTGIIIGLGALGFVLILVGVWMYFFGRRKSDEEDDGIEDEADEVEDEIMDSILALDDQFKSGNLEESIYKARRKELTDKLKLVKK